MSQAKSAQARAAKRNARAKQKQTAAAKARVSPKTLQTKKFRAELSKIGIQGMNFDKVLNNAVRDANKGKEVETTLNSPEEVIEALKKNTGELFKLYCYVIFAEALVSKKTIEHTFTVDIDAMSASLIDLDKRISLLPRMLGVDEDAVMTEALDIGTTIAGFSDELYAEVSLLESSALIIEECLNRLAADVTEEEDEGKRRTLVLSTLAYKRLNEVLQSTIPATPVTEPVPEEVTQ